MPGAQLLLLMNEGNFFPFQFPTYQFFFESRNDNALFEFCLTNNPDDLFHHGHAANPMQHLRELRFHSGTLSGGQNDCC